jgi:hypothetical protein
MERFLVVTIDTEVDKDAHWRIADPVRFRSVVEGIPGVFTPLFQRHGVRPTYFLSPEVMEDDESADVLRRLDGAAELATHLHAEFVEPNRRLFRHNMGGAQADALQLQYPRAVEAEKLARLTEQFSQTFGRKPTAFRAGRYGMSAHTLELLAGLGYRVDSSVTPGLNWNYAEGRVDFRAWEAAPRWVQTPSGKLLELPLSIRPRGPLGGRIGRSAPGLRRFITRAIGDERAFEWLRPSWRSGRSLIAHVDKSDEKVFVLMLHSMEVIPGASPYARSPEDAQRIVGAMDELFAHCRNRGIRFCTASEVAAYV